VSLPGFTAGASLVRGGHYHTAAARSSPAACIRAAGYSKAEIDMMVCEQFCFPSEARSMRADGKCVCADGRIVG
jgi:hypothetical protein